MKHLSGSPETTTQRQSAQETSYQWLRNYIAALPHHTGTFITEVDVSDRLGISRTPVREALLRLETEGFLEIVPKKGAYVPAISSTEAEAVMQARLMVEDWCAQRVTDDVVGLVSELTKLVDRQETLLDNPVEFIECDRQFHRTFVQASGNQVVAKFYESLRDRQIRMGVQAVGAADGRAKTVVEEHRAIVAAISDHGPEDTAAAVGQHLESTWTAVLKAGLGRGGGLPMRSGL